MAFRQLRQVFNIDAGDYMLSVCGKNMSCVTHAVSEIRVPSCYFHGAMHELPAAHVQGFPPALIS